MTAEDPQGRHISLSEHPAPREDNQMPTQQIQSRGDLFGVYEGSLLLAEFRREHDANLFVAARENQNRGREGVDYEMIRESVLHLLPQDRSWQALLAHAQAMVALQEEERQNSMNMQVVAGRLARGIIEYNGHDPDRYLVTDETAPLRPLQLGNYCAQLRVYDPDEPEAAEVEVMQLIAPQ